MTDVSRTYHVVSDDGKYLGITGKTVEDKITRAGSWDINKAKRVLGNIPVHIKKDRSWKVESFNVDREGFIGYENVMEAGEFARKVTSVIGSYKELKDYADKLSNSYIQIELEISDIYHYIQFNNLNIVDGYRVYKMLQDKLTIRNNLKDCIDIWGNIKGGINISVEDNSIDKMVERLDNRVYTPRILTELFEEGEK